MRSLLEYGEDPLKILGMISRHFRLLSLVKEMEGEGRSRGEMGRRFRIPAPYLQSLLSQSSSVSWGFLEKAFQDLLRADLFLKSEKGLGILTLERLIFDLSQICEPPLSQMDYGRKGEAKRCL
jgi:DNA polymerase-3 subunit delta